MSVHHHLHRSLVVVVVGFVGVREVEPAEHEGFASFYSMRAWRQRGREDQWGKKAGCGVGGEEGEEVCEG